MSDLNVGVERLQVVWPQAAIEGLHAVGVHAQRVPYVEDEIMLIGLDDPAQLAAAQAWANANGFEREQCGDVYTVLWPAE